MNAYVDRAYTASGINVQCLYLAKGNGPAAAEIAKWFDELAMRTGFARLINQVLSVVCIEAAMLNAPPDIRVKGCEGYFDPNTKVLWMAAHAASPDLLAHEIGHHVSVTLGPAASAELIAELFKVTFVPNQQSASDTFRAFVRKAGW